MKQRNHNNRTAMWRQTNVLQNRAKPSWLPAGVNYDLWLGPAPKHPFTRNRWHYKWHWFWDYGGGDLVNDGIHHIDLAVWGLGKDQQYPRQVGASGTQLWYDDDHETPDTQITDAAVAQRQRALPNCEIEK